MSDNKDTLQESILIKRAKRRLLGAITILISLIVLSYFFLEDPNEVKKITNVKVSFLSKSEKSLNLDQRNIRVDFESAQNQVLKMEDLKDNQPKKQNSDETYFIQVGIFGVENNANKTKDQMLKLNLPVNILDFQIKGKPYWRVVAGPASSSDSRRSMLKIIKSAGFKDAYFISN